MLSSRQDPLFRKTATTRSNASTPFLFRRGWQNLVQIHPSQSSRTSKLDEHILSHHLFTTRRHKSQTQRLVGIVTMLTSGKHPMQNRPIHAFRDCDVSTKASIRDCFTSWGKVVMDDPAPLSDEELKQHADQLVFDGWDAFMKPDAPSFEAPQVSATRVQIGYFSKVRTASSKRLNYPEPKLTGLEFARSKQGSLVVGDWTA